MPILEEIYIGFDPRQAEAPPPDPVCGNEPAFGIWREKIVHHASDRRGGRYNTGINYSLCYSLFDAQGNYLREGPWDDVQCAGFAGNETCALDGEKRCKTPDEWLGEARNKVRADQYPEPGTMFFLPSYLAKIGTA